MKKILTTLVLTALFSASSFAATQITHEEAANYTKIGNLSYTQDGLPTVGTEQIAAEADKKCQELGNVAAANCYYVIVAEVGGETDNKNINLELFKK